MTITTPAVDRKKLAIELFIVSLTSLFFELLVIRWFGCDFRTFAVFKNFPLVACFIGLGVGVAKADNRLFRYAPVAMLLFAVVVKIMSAVGFGDMSFPSTGVYQWMSFNATYGAQLGQFIVGMMLAIVLILSGPFGVMVCIGARIGVLFNAQKPLDAYCLDIGGAITGSVIFAIMSFLWISPAVQFCMVAAVLIICTHKHCRPAWLSSSALIAAVAIILMPVGGDTHTDTIWTPYYKIQKEEILVPKKFLDPPGTGDKWVGILEIVNHGFHQAFLPDLKLNAEGEKVPVLKTLKGFFQARQNYYKIPYTIKQPKELLILGAGSGSDVYVALKNGVEDITGVEIDPGIIKVGERYNEAYHSPKVHIHCGDGRNFINKSTRQYDMIIFACLDSTSLSGIGSSVRTDSYIHTMQSYRKCLSLLKPDGLLVVSFGAAENGSSDWLRDRMFATLREAAGYPPLFLTDEKAPVHWPAYIFVSGNPVRQGLIKPLSDPNSFKLVDLPANLQARILTDDWPYLYIRPVGVDIPYILVLLEVLLIAGYAGRQLLFAKQNVASDWQLFFMGGAFMLLELQSITRLSLAYGATWVTASVVINGVLLMILGANLIVVKAGAIKRQGILYALLIASLIFSYFMPVESMLSWGAGAFSVGHLAMTVLTLLPMFVAGLIFASAFSYVKSPARSFAFNLLGSVLGALFEYTSTYCGVKSLLIVAAVLYILSLLFYCRIRPEVKLQDTAV